ncbi:uncharacterized protein [Ptychodera flava]|uniref:uncharacterized protein isoform X2 n=1 Tax=Ptychodera flava TaxID=63121 RepID=UPI00396A84F1
MATSMEHEIRKLRKKLRQIENLERLERPLSDEEISKVLKKSNIRNSLQDILSHITVSPNASNVSSTDEEKQGHENDVQSLAETPQHVTDTRDSDDIVKPEKRKGIIKPEEIDSQENEILPAKVAKTEYQTGQDNPAQVFKDESKSKIVSSQSLMIEAQKLWRSSQFTVRELEGHNDVITCVDCDEVFIVTGSRDTTVKVWDGETGLELCSLGGHTATVTVVRLLSNDEGQRIDILTEDLDDDENSRIAISGSLDCSIKVWNITEGHLLKSIYAYNPLQCLVYLSYDGSILSGSDGGKLELWDMVRGESLHSIISGNGSVTDMVSSFQVSKGNSDELYIVTGFEDGMVKVWRIRNQQLSLLFVADDIKSSSSQVITLRRIQCLAAFQDTIYYGDNGVNVKALQWKTASLHKLKNHLCEFGSTNAMVIAKEVMMCSGYNLDQGMGYINVWTMPGEHYLGTLNDQQTNKIFGVACTKTRKGLYRIVSVGDEFKIWDQVTSRTSSRHKDYFGIDYNWSYTIKPEDSNSESDKDLSDDETDTRVQARQEEQRPSSEHTHSSKGLWSWCVVI